MALKTPEEGRSFLNPDDFNSQVREYIRAKKSIDMLDGITKKLRETLFSQIDLQGEEDLNGNVVLSLGADIEGFVGIEKQRRVSRKLNEPLAETIINAKGIGAAIYETKQVINEEALMAAYYNGDITEEELDSMFPANVTWALRTLKK
jgi:hypothetical protein